MVAMGGGPELPSRSGSKEKELVLCALPWPQELCERGMKELREAFDDVEVKYFQVKYDDGKSEMDAPEGKTTVPMYTCSRSHFRKDAGRKATGSRVANGSTPAMLYKLISFHAYHLYARYQT